MIDGMFFDEMNSQGSADDLTYYGQIYAYVKSKGGKARVIQNPGATPPTSLLGCADVFLSYERPASAYAQYDASLERSRTSPLFWHAIYACSPAAMPGIIAASRDKKATYVYVTDLPSDQRWRHIAGYFPAEVNEVRKGNNPPVVLVR